MDTKHGEHSSGETTDLLIDEHILFRKLAYISPNPTLITNTKGEICYVNPAWNQLTGYSFDEVKGKNPRILNSGKTPRRVFRKLWSALSSGQTFSSDEIFDKRKDQSEYQIYATYFPIKRGDVNEFYVQVQHDITKQREMNEKRNMFISIASHELKTPITTLSAYAQLLKKQLVYQCDNKNLALLSHIIYETNRLTNLIDDLLNVGRLESGDLPFYPKALNLSALVQQLVTDLSQTIQTHTIEIKGSIKGTVLGDKNRIEQVLTNLITNAVKYSPQANRILVHLSTTATMAIVAVQDFGYGIDKKDQQYIFTRFYRTQDKDEGSIAGFGLGLYIASEIIKRHKGKLWVESKKGTGSTFYFSLPLLRSYN